MNIMIVTVAYLGAVLTLAYSQECDPSQSCASQQPYAHLVANKDQPLNHFYLAGMFDVHEIDPNPYKCGALREKGIQNMQAFFWALETFRQRYNETKLFEGVDVGGLAFDFCTRPHQAVQYLFNLERCDLAYGADPPVKPSNILAYIGPARSSQALEAGRILGHMKKTVISHSANSPTLSDTNVFKTFLRTQPSDSEQSQVLIEIINAQSNWEAVQVVYRADEDGTAGKENFKKMAVENGLCVAQEIKLPLVVNNAVMDGVVDKLSAFPNTKGVIIFGTHVEARNVLQAIKRRGAEREFTFMSTTSWSTLMQVVKGVEEAADGAVTLSLVPGNMDFFNAFRDYYRALRPTTNLTTQNPIFASFWEEKFACDLPGSTNRRVPCEPNTNNLDSSEIDLSTAYVIQAVDVALHGIENARSAMCPNVNQICTEFSNSDAQLDKIYAEILKISLPGVSFQGNGDAAVVNFAINKFSANRNQYELIETYVKGTPLSQPPNMGSSTCPTCQVCEAVTSPITTTTISAEQSSSATTASTTSTTLRTTSGGNGGQTQPTAAPQQQKAPSGIRKQDSWVIAILVLSSLGILLIIVFEVYIIVKVSGTPFSKWKVLWLGQLLLFGIFLSYLVLFAYVPYQTTATCGIIRFGIGFCYAFMFGVLIVKLMNIFQSKKTGYLHGVFQILLFLFILLVQVGIDSTWLIVEPAQGVWVTGQTWYCRHLHFSSHVLSLVYVMFLILLCIILAVRSYRVKSNHRENILIGIAAGATAALWIAWTLIGHLSPHSREDFSDYWDPATAFGLWCTATLILLVMFLPKVKRLKSMTIDKFLKAEDEWDRGSVMTGSVYKAPGSVVYVNNGAYAGGVNGTLPSKQPPHDNGLYTDVPTLSRSVHSVNDPHGLVLRHPGSVYESNTMRSAPPNVIYGTPGTLKSQRGGGGSVYSYGRPYRPGTPVDYAARSHTLDARSKPSSEYAYPTSTNKAKHNMKKAKSYQDLGPL
ncbi:metabotropic glutamate receptor 2 [Lingula anatina]|uniref:Metabotropic glutamate receptor 2 n=1 Tax=Lingula anatina TaxID=7574 RepID=A0A1S3J4H0_LINAN|nr:metabotropic glutamate receptor 2 [Lingula anatina]XP_013405162.1 metabotropic glutamate receptor 2 [Lingula anatina]|eukprot:XP_013405161.1 metabotropic glutamate receptor 2 [Lingula anatina]